MAVVDHEQARCDEVDCDRDAVYLCELTGFHRCDHHRLHCDHHDCDRTVTFRCARCARRLCSVHRQHRRPPPVTVEPEAATIIRGTSICLACASARQTA